MRHFYAILTLVFAACFFTRSATITGPIYLAYSNRPYSGALLFRPLSTPLPNTPNLITGGDFKVFTDTNGLFSVNLQPGNYRVTVGADRSFTIDVPTNAATYTLLERITNALSWNSSIIPATNSYALALTTRSGVVKTTSDQADPVAWLTNDTATIGRWLGSVTAGTIDELIATTAPDYDVDNIVVNGWSSKLDGRGGQWYYDYGSTVSTNLGTVVEWGSGRLRRYHPTSYVEAKWFGAKADGTTDATAAIQSAIDTVGYGTVQLDGTNLVSNLLIKRGIVLRGHNNYNTTLKALSGSTGWMVRLDDTISGAQLDTEFNQVPSIIENLSMEGNNRGSDIGGIYLNRIDYVTIRNVFIWRFQRSGLFLNNSVRESLFDNISVRFCGKRDATNNNGTGWPAVSFVDWETSTGSTEDKLNGLRLQNSQIVFSLGDGLAIDTRQMSSGRRVNNISVQNCWIHGWSDAFWTVEYANTLTNSATLRQYDLVKVGASYDVRFINNRFSFTGQNKPAINPTTSTLGGSAVSGLTYTPEKVQIIGNFFNHRYNSTLNAADVGIKADVGTGIVTDNISEGLSSLYSISSGWKSTQPRVSTADGLTFEPTISGSYAGGTMQSLGTSPYTMHVKVRLPDSIPASAGALFSVGSSAGTTSTPGFAIYISSNGNLYPVLYGSTLSDRRIATIPPTVLETLLGQVVDFVFTRSGSTFKVYINGGEYTYTEETVGTPPAWSDSLASTRWNIGAGVGTPWPSTIHEFRVANRVLSASEVMSLSRGTVPVDMWGSMTAQTSGLLTVGYRYRIAARAVSGSDFTTVGSSDNTVGTEFVATGTGSGLLDASNNVLRLGWIVDPDLIGNSGTTVYDRSTNDGDGSLVGNGVKWIKTVGAPPAASASAVPIDQPDRGYSWDGIQSSSYIGGLSQQLGTDPFTVNVRVRYPSANPTNAAGIFTLTTGNGLIAVNGCGLVLQTSGVLEFILYGATGSDFRIASVSAAQLTSFAGVPVNLTVTRSGSTLAMYVNGTALTYSESTGGSAPAWSSSLTTDRYNIGNFTAGQVWNSTISAFRVANRALSATEVAALNRGVGTADVWGSSTILNSGTLTVGKRYRIVAQSTSNFTTVGASSSTVGTEFVATGTGSGLLDASNTVRRIGWFVDPDLANGLSGLVLDRTSNLLHATVYGAGVVPIPANANYALSVDEVTVASSGTTSIGAAFSDKVYVTGTTTITSFGAALAGTRRNVRFEGALTLTYNASSMVLPGASSITTAAGDTLEAHCISSGNWRVVWYQRASGHALAGGGGGGGGGGSGDVVGPSSATDNAVVRFDGTTGKLVQNSAVTIADTTGDITAGKYNTVAISGSSTPTLAVTGTSSISGSNTGDQSGANPSASIGLSAVNGVATTFMRSDAAPALDLSIAPTWTGAHTFSKNGALSLPTFSVTGTPITGGTATTTKPLALIETAGAASTAWSTSGTMLGINAPSGFAGRPIDVQVNGSSALNLTAGGTLTAAGNIFSGGTINAPSTGDLVFSTRGRIDSPADGVLTLKNNAETDFTRLQLGGTTTSFPAIERSGTTVAIKLADGSADAPLTASAVNKVAITAPATGSTLTIADGKTFTASNTLTLSGTDGSTLNIGTGGTLGTAAYTATGAYQAADSELTAIAGLTSAADRLPYFTSSGTASLATFTSAGRALVDDADASAQRTTLGLGTVATESTVPVAKGGTGATTASGALDALNVAETTVASATTTDLGAVASDKVSITGTTTITSFGTANAGVKREGRFTGALTLTHNATSLIIPGAANITTAAGDRFGAYSLGSGNWVVTWYTKADGTALVGGGGGAVATDSIWDAAGDLVVGTGSNTADRLAIGPVGATLISDGTTAEWFHPRTHFTMYEDFVGSESAGDYAKYGWSRYVSGGQVAFTASEAGRPGILAPETGTTTSGYANLLFRPTSQFLLGGGRIVAEWAVKLPTLSDASNTYTVYMGFQDSSAGSGPVDSAHFEYSHGVNSGAWQTKTTSNSTATTTSTATTVDTSWHRYSLEVNAAASSITFYIDGTSVATHTTNIPTGAGRETSFGFLISKSAGTTTRYIYVDYMSLYQKLTTSR